MLNHTKISRHVAWKSSPSEKVKQIVEPNEPKIWADLTEGDHLTISFAKTRTLITTVFFYYPIVYQQLRFLSDVGDSPRVMLDRGL